MSRENYQSFIRTLCEVVGIANWESVASTQHIEVDSSALGLIYDEHVAPNTLHLYLDLGFVNQADMESKLLEMNAILEPTEAGAGYFALHPDRGSIVYRSTILLTSSLCGVDSASEIESFVAVGKQKLMAVLKGTDSNNF